MLSRVKVQFLYSRLRFLQCSRYHAVLDGFVFRDLKCSHDALYDVGGKDAHERIFKRNKKLRLAGISLTSGATAKLIVDAPSFVPLGSEHIESAARLYVLILFVCCRIAA